jgi:hypothetical protein
MLVWLSALFCPPGYGRIERPAFPAPSDWRVRIFSKPRAKTRGETADLYLLCAVCRIGHQNGIKTVKNLYPGIVQRFHRGEREGRRRPVPMPPPPIFRSSTEFRAISPKFRRNGSVKKPICIPFITDDVLVRRWLQSRFFPGLYRGIKLGNVIAKYPNT